MVRIVHRNRWEKLWVFTSLKDTSWSGFSLYILTGVAVRLVPGRGKTHL